jgi:hypothetical protein
MQNTTHCFNDNKKYSVTSYSITKIQRSKRAMGFPSAKIILKLKPITIIKKYCKNLLKQLGYTKELEFETNHYYTTIVSLPIS